MFAKNSRHNVNPSSIFQKEKENDSNQSITSGVQQTKMRPRNLSKLTSVFGKSPDSLASASTKSSDILPRSVHQKITVSRKIEPSILSRQSVKFILETQETGSPTSQVVHKESQQNVSPFLPLRTCSSTDLSAVPAHSTILDKPGSLPLQQGSLNSILISSHPSNMVQDTPLGVSSITLSPATSASPAILCTLPCDLTFPSNQSQDDDAFKIFFPPTIPNHSSLSTYSSEASACLSSTFPRIYSDFFTQNNHNTTQNLVPSSDKSAPSYRNLQLDQGTHDITGLTQQVSPSPRSDSDPLIIEDLSYSNGGVIDDKLLLQKQVQSTFLHSGEHTKHTQPFTKMSEHATTILKGTIAHKKKYSSSERSFMSIKSQNSDVIFSIKNTDKRDDNAQSDVVEKNSTCNSGLDSLIVKGPLILLDSKAGKENLQGKIFTCTETNNKGFNKKIHLKKVNSIHQKKPNSANELKGQKIPRNPILLASQRQDITQSSRARIHKDLSWSHTKQRKSLITVARPSAMVSVTIPKGSSKSRKRTLSNMDFTGTLNSFGNQSSITSHQIHLSSSTSSYADRPCTKFFVAVFVFLICKKLIRVVHERRRIIFIETIKKPHAAYIIQCAWRRYQQCGRIACWRAARFLVEWLRFKLPRLRRTREESVHILHQVLLSKKTLSLVRSTCQEIHYKTDLDMITRCIKCLGARKILSRLKLERDERNILIQKCYQASLRIYRDERFEFLGLIKEAQKVLSIHPKAPVLQCKTGILRCSYHVSDVQDESEVETNKANSNSNVPKAGVQHITATIVDKSNNSTSPVNFLALASTNQTSAPSHALSEAESTINEVHEAAPVSSCVSSDKVPMWRQCRHGSLIFLNDKIPTSPHSGSMRSMHSAPCIMWEATRTLSSVCSVGPDVDGCFEGDLIAVDVSCPEVQVMDNDHKKGNFPTAQSIPVALSHSDPPLNVMRPFREPARIEDHEFLKELFQMETDAYLDVKFSKKSEWINGKGLQLQTQCDGREYALNNDSVNAISNRNAGDLLSQYANVKLKAYSPSSSTNLTEAAHNNLEGSRSLVHRSGYLHFFPSTLSNHEMGNNISNDCPLSLPRTLNDHSGYQSEDVLHAQVDLLICTESIERKALTWKLLDAHKTLYLPVHNLNLAHYFCSSATVPPFFASLLLSMKDEMFMRRAAKLFAEEHKRRISITEVYDSLPLRFLVRPLLSSRVGRQRRIIVENAYAAHNSLMLPEEKDVFLGDHLDSINAAQHGMIKPIHPISTHMKSNAENSGGDSQILMECLAEGLDQDTVYTNQRHFVVRMAHQSRKVCKTANTDATNEIIWPQNANVSVKNIVDVGVPSRVDKGEVIVTDTSEKTLKCSGPSVSSSKPLDAYINRAKKKRCEYVGVSSKEKSALPHLTKKHIQSYASNSASSNVMPGIIAANTSNKIPSGPSQLPDIKDSTYGMCHDFRIYPSADVSRNEVMESDACCIKEHARFYAAKDS
ncbi:unnamed protein product [Phytomonas sp. Hart1]|nr:unnamed protein product [Phytomonas sp. Hart1]|eukprot:CCW69143.1 unnamed protein product [Phytomonas sp. isolate Hart1]